MSCGGAVSMRMTSAEEDTEIRHAASANVVIFMGRL